MEQAKLREGIAEILEVPTVTGETDLNCSDGGWDSIRIVSAISLIDEIEGVTVDAVALAKCSTVADVEALVERALGRTSP